MFVCLFDHMFEKTFLEEGKWVSNHYECCLTSEADVDGNSPVLVNPGKRTNIPKGPFKHNVIKGVGGRGRPNDYAIT